MTRWFGAAILCLALLAAGCGGPEDAELTVLAASSTRLALDDAVEAFERESGIDVAVSYAGSQTLAAQVAAGFPADIFISADVVHLERLRADDLVANWTSIASNSLAILVADDNPLGITGLDEVLLRDDLVIVAADPAVPLGAHTERLLVQLGHSLDGDDLRLASQGTTRHRRDCRSDLVSALGCWSQAWPRGADQEGDAGTRQGWRRRNRDQPARCQTPVRR